MHRIKDLTVLAGNGSLNQSGKDAIALELEALNKDLVSIANSKHLGRNIFAGNSDADAAFTPGTPRDPANPADPGTPPVFQGAGDQPGGTAHQRHPDSPGRRRRRSDLRQRRRLRLRHGGQDRRAAPQAAGTSPRSSAPLETSFKNIVNGRAEIGTRQAQLERAGTVNTELEATLDAQRTGIEKADLGSVIMDLKLQETNYQVALAATARVLQPTLMDFLR